jgi:serine/threonine-protein kinase RsbW
VPALRIDASPENLAVIRRFVRAAAAAEGLDADRADRLVQAVDESATNVILHGYRDAPGELEIDAHRDGGDLVVILRDHAPPFDPTTVPMPDIRAPLARRRAGGMGVFLARELSDDVRYRAMPGGGNELVLVQRNIDRQSEQTTKR